MDVLIGLIQLFCIDAIVIAALLILAIVMGIYRRASLAVLNRNFVAYFTNPTGYVFLCLFVLLASAAAFWPHEFFTSNLANLDQLNRYLPYIMVIFIPAITMSIWAEERRQGTDELLLTLPATDFDIVVGKYFAAAGIFTVSLLFSQVSNFLVLAILSVGDLDIGQFAVTYLGYWLIGLAMLALGMVASFLTNNLTVGFVFGVIFNLPLVLLAWADVIIPLETLAQVVSRWSIASQFQDFGRGVVTFSGIAYFGMTIAFGLYLALVLIGRRHWLGGRDGESRIWHYLLRAVCLAVIVLGLNLVFYRYNPVRGDMTDQKLSSASPETRDLLRNLKPKNKIVINAFIGSPIPDRYIRTKFELLAMLREFEARSNGNIEVRIHDNLSTVGEEAKRAEELYGITVRQVGVQERGVVKQADVLLGVAITCGLEKVVIPFLDAGLPVEYELIRSVTTVAGQTRKTIGIVNSDANLMGGFTMAGMMPQSIPKQAIVDELEKQYQVEQIDASAPIQVEIDDPENKGKKKLKYDVMLVAQPSSLAQAQLDNVITAIRQGQPTAIFEDPFPYFFQGTPATDEPKQSGGMFGGPQEPKGDITTLWKVLNIEVRKDRIVWQKYMPYLRLDLDVINDSWVFVRREAPGAGDIAFSETDPVSANLEELLFLAPGFIRPAAATDYKFYDLARTGDETGTISLTDLQSVTRMNEALSQYAGAPTRFHYTLAARIQSPNVAKNGGAENKTSATETSGTKTSATGPRGQFPGKLPAVTPVKWNQVGQDPVKPSATPPTPSADKINVIYVADLDCLSREFVAIRAAGEGETVVNFRFDNIPFVLNIVDSLAGDDRYLEIRKRKRRYGTLKVVDRQIEAFKLAQQKELEEAEKALEKKLQEAEDSAKKATQELQDKIAEIQKKQAAGEDFDIAEFQRLTQKLDQSLQVSQQRNQQERLQIAEERRAKLQELRRQGELTVASIQNRYKLAALIFPPIPPLLIGIVVFAWRRLQEREGISKSRRR